MFIEDVAPLMGRPDVRVGRQPTNNTRQQLSQITKGKLYQGILPYIPMSALQRVRRGPYAHTLAITNRATMWRESVARQWAQWHIAISVFLLAIGCCLVGVGINAGLGLSIIGLGLVTLSLNTIALRCFMLPGMSAILLLFADILFIGYGVIALGTSIEIFFLLPGTLIVVALLTNYTIVVVSCIMTFLGYISLQLLSPLDLFSSALLLNTVELQILHITLVGIGLMLLLIALGFMMYQLRSSLTSEASLKYRLQVIERQARTKRTTMEADSIALQTELAQTLRGGMPHRISVCEEFAPLAHTIGTVTSRLPGFLRDREDRLRLERAIRDLRQSLQAIQSGFKPVLPSDTGTSVDQLVSTMRSILPSP
jgi:hypothetical protein